jgi:hypothetical protein
MIVITTVMKTTTREMEKITSVVFAFSETEKHNNIPSKSLLEKVINNGRLPQIK